MQEHRVFVFSYHTASGGCRGAIVHLLGGPGKPRRIKFTGSSITGLRADERSIAGRIRKVVVEPLPPIGAWKQVSQGMAHSGGLSTYYGRRMAENGCGRMCARREW